MDVYNYLPEDIVNCLENYKYIDSITEIRLRKNNPVQITLKGKNQVLNSKSVSQNELDNILFNICQGSVNVFEDEISNGYITMENGYRVGIGGEFYYNPTSKKYLLKELDSLNIRIARNVIGFENQDKINVEKSSLIVGAPHSGKTSLIKLITKDLSKKYRIAVCDERNEISSNNINCDVIKGVKKSIAISMATRTLNPEFIICDEIGFESESSEILSATNTGVKFICSAHGENIKRVFKRPNIKILIDNEIFEQIIFLSQKNDKFYVEEVIDV